MPFVRYSVSKNGVSPRDIENQVRGRSRSLKMAPFQNFVETVWMSYMHMDGP